MKIYADEPSNKSSTIYAKPYKNTNVIKEKCIRKDVIATVMYVCIQHGDQQIEPNRTFLNLKMVREKMATRENTVFASRLQGKPSL